MAVYVEEADRAHTAGQDDEQLDAYVDAIFVAGRSALSPDQVSFVLARTEGSDVKEIVGP